MKAYICIGGPLDNEYATTDDFNTYDWQDKPKGMYAHLAHEYMQYNGNGKPGRSRDGYSSMVWLHTSLVKKPISPRSR